MPWTSPFDWVPVWLETIKRASIFGAVAICGTWTICRLFPRMPATVMSWAWRLIALKLILLVFLPGPLAAPFLPAPGFRIERSKHSAPATDASVIPVRSALSEPVGREWFGERRRQELVLFGLWTLGLAAVWIRTARQVRESRRILSEARPITHDWLRRENNILCERFRLRRSPNFLCHGAVTGPQTVGVWRVNILLPASFLERHSQREIGVVLAHELAHVARRDVLWAWVRRFAHAIFFFHPLVWLADRQAELADEMACDELAVAAGNASAAEYAGALVRVTEEGLTRRTPMAALMSRGMGRSYHGLCRRLEALLKSPDSEAGWYRRRRTAVFGSVAIALLLPIGILNWRQQQPNIQQIDPRYAVLGVNVSRGNSHVVSAERDLCRFAGLALSRTRVDVQSKESQGPSGSGAQTATGLTSPSRSNARESVPVRVAGWLQKLGFRPQLESRSYSSSFSLAGDSCAVRVRFKKDARWTGHQSIQAILLDENGESINLGESRDEVLSGLDEYVKLWVIHPAPMARARFDLRLWHKTENRDVARIRLGEL